MQLEKSLIGVVTTCDDETMLSIVLAIQTQCYQYLMNIFLAADELISSLIIHGNIICSEI